MSRFTYTGRRTNEISFPLGGIGAGCIGLSGNGRLIDWEIYNRPNKGSTNGLTHFAVRAERDGKVLDTRILQGDLSAPYMGVVTSQEYVGFGWGPERETLCGLPHFREHTFCGTFPCASILFSGEPTFPGTATLHAWSPFIPGNEDDSGLPVAFFEIELTNTTDLPVDYTVIGALANPFETAQALNRIQQVDGKSLLTVTSKTLAPDDLRFGAVTLGVEAADVSYQEYWYRGGWCDSLQIYWRDVMAGGRFHNRTYDIDRIGGDRCTGHLAVHLSLGAGETRRIRFLITWHFPNCTNYWHPEDAYAQRIAANGLTNAWRNWYATRWEDSVASACYGLAEGDRLHDETYRFQRVLFSSSLPEAALDAVSAPLSVLKSPTCLRLEDGTFYGWEGVGSTYGSCEGSCTHVWNYAQALPFLFPRLERSMRTAHYRYSIDKDGGNHCRILLPVGIQAEIGDRRPCADGTFGDVIKTYRDWKISGDTAWLRELWPTIRRTIEYAWSEANPDRWDPEQTGVLWGRQHHTLDMELFGPNAWLTGLYLAALKAAAELAPVCDDVAFGEHCRTLFEKGKVWTDEHLFNGAYYIQQIDLADRNLLKPFDSDPRYLGGADASDVYWSEEHGQIKYQVGEGCDIDMTVAQWHANLYGLGQILDPEQVRSALDVTYRTNFHASMRDVYNPWRIFALNDEAGMQICAWPEGREQPMIPVRYSQEAMHGFEYAAAIQMIQCGMVEQGMAVVRGVRDRYDGERRNPWNEIECGSNYARSMAAYALLNAFSGFQFDLAKGFIGFAPQDQKQTDFRCFWALDGAWGEVVYTAASVTLNLLAGELTLTACDFGVRVKRVVVDDQEIDWSEEGSRIQFLKLRTVRTKIWGEL